MRATFQEATSHGRGARGFALAAVVGTALTLSATTVQAQTSGTSSPDEAKVFRVAFASTTSCRDPGEFVDQLQRRTGRLRVATEGEPALTFQITLTDTQAGTQGELHVQEPEGASITRQVPGVDCHEVISAMALIGALMVDPLAAAMAPPSPPRSPQRVVPPPPLPAEPAPPSDERWFFGFGQRLTVDSGLAPEFDFGSGAFVELGRTVESPWVPSVRASARRASSVASAGELGSAEFSSIAGRVAACPASFELAADVELRPCAVFELAWLTAEGFDTQSAAEVTVVVPRLGAELALSVRVVGPLRLGAEFGLLASLAGEETFYFVPRGAPGATVFTLPTLGFSGGIGLGVSFF